MALCSFRISKPAHPCNNTLSYIFFASAPLPHTTPYTQQRSNHASPCFSNKYSLVTPLKTNPPLSLSHVTDLERPQPHPMSTHSPRATPHGSRSALVHCCASLARLCALLKFSKANTLAYSGGRDSLGSHELVRMLLRPLTGGAITRRRQGPAGEGGNANNDTREGV